MDHAAPENFQTSNKEMLAAIPALRRFSRTFHKSQSAADDLVQETLVRAWQALDRYQPGTSMNSWLFTIMRNVFISDYRKRGRETTGFTTDIAEYQGAQAAPQEWKLRARDVEAALHSLPTEQRIAIVLCCVLGHSYHEVADICGCEIGTIKSRISRGKLTLLALLGEESRLSVLEPDYRSSTPVAISAFV